MYHHTFLPNHYFYRDDINFDQHHQLVQLDSNGSFLNQYEFELSGYSVFNSMMLSPDGNLILYGKMVESVSQQDGLIVKISKDGNVLWENIYGGNSNDFIYDATINSDGHPVFWGSTASFSPKGLWMLSINWDGEVLDERTIYSPSGGQNIVSTHPIIDAISTEDGTLVSSIGEFANCSRDDHEFYWFSQDLELVTSWVYGEDNNRTDRMYRSTFSEDNSVLAIGYVEEDVQDAPSHLTLIKLAPSLISNSDDTYTNPAKVTVFPNPANEKVEVIYENTNPFSLRIYNSYGNLCFQGLNSKLVDTANFSNGVYYLVFQDHGEDDFTYQTLVVSH